VTQKKHDVILRILRKNPFRGVGCRNTHANFGEDRLRGFGVAMDRILAFSVIHWPAWSQLKHSGTTVQCIIGRADLSLGLPA